MRSCSPRLPEAGIEAEEGAGSAAMERPRYVSDAISVSPSGLHTGSYGPFTLHAAYQPIFACGPPGLSLAAFEGLVRPALGERFVAPGALFAETDRGDRLFVECMCRALHLRNYQLASPARLNLFINVNPAIYESVEVIEREFDFMFSILHRYGLEGSRLVCELVEEEALSNPVLARLCARFRAGGARIAIDDFGTGKSGVERYRALQPELVKVDGEMFRGMAGSAGGRRMLASLARTFLADGTTILVEGIETAEQQRVAADIGATLMQGFGLAPPKLLPHDFSSDYPMAAPSAPGLTASA